MSNKFILKTSNKFILLAECISCLPYTLWLKDENGDDISVNDQDVDYGQFCNAILSGKVKPYFRQMSSMTLEEKKEYKSFFFGKQAMPSDFSAWPIEYYTLFEHDAKNLLDWLTSRHFDYREFIGQQLALRAKDGMYMNTDPDEYCRNNCRGYKDTGGKCFVDGKCQDYIDYQKGKPTEILTLKFDPTTLQPFDKVLARWSKGSHPWELQLFSHFCKPGWAEFIGNATEGFMCDMIIPYNEETKSVANTFQDPPEYYRYWERKNNE